MDFVNNVGVICALFLTVQACPLSPCVTSKVVPNIAMGICTFIVATETGVEKVFTLCISRFLYTGNMTVF